VPPPTPNQQGRGATRVEFNATDGQPLFGFLITPAGADSTNSPTGIILHFHGNGDLADSWLDWAEEVAQRTGLSVFLAEYRGYGGLPGRPTFEGLMRDARAALSVLDTEFGTDPSEVVLYAHSLGTGVATHLALEHTVRALVLEAPITSVVDVARRNLGPPLSWVVPLISRIPLAPVEAVRSIHVPVSVVSGERDDVAPSWMGREVFDAAIQKGDFLLIPQGEHGNLSTVGGDQYWEFVEKALNGTKGGEPRSITPRSGGTIKLSYEIGWHVASSWLAISA
jgi:fermentation-respiration switch protein FrsA (DUF1100 family)